MLALHDLMGASYPSGRLDVDRLPVTRLAGFGGAEARVLAEARRLKADGFRHAHLRGPLALTVRVGPLDARPVAPIVVIRGRRGRPRRRRAAGVARGGRR